MTQEEHSVQSQSQGQGQEQGHGPQEESALEGSPDRLSLKITNEAKQICLEIRSVLNAFSLNPSFDMSQLIDLLQALKRLRNCVVGNTCVVFLSSLLSFFLFLSLISPLFSSLLISSPLSFLFSCHLFIHIDGYVCKSKS
jgi:hypothetical protein